MQHEREHTPVSEVSLGGLLQPGQRVGRYEICARLAAGGMATIYLARAEGPGGFRKLVALKCIHPHLVVEESFVEMFLDEARLASRVDHPNVVDVFDFGFADGVYFIAMGHLVGEPASRVRRQLASTQDRAAALRFALKIAADVATGLDAVHELRDDHGKLLDVVHRDVSPANVLVTYDGAVKLLDFGIARAMDQLHHTRTGALKGTLAYMSPEQMSHGPIDRRSDLFAWGAVAWELCTGETLFRRATEVATMRAVLDEPIPSLGARRPEMPPALVELIDACLSRVPSARPRAAREVAAALGSIVAATGHAADALALGAWMRSSFPTRFAEQHARVEEARRTSFAAPSRVQIPEAADVATKPMAEAPRPRAGRKVAIAGGLALLGAAALFVFAPRPERTAPQAPPPTAAPLPTAEPLPDEPPPAEPVTAPVVEERPPAPGPAKRPKPPVRRKPPSPTPPGEGFVNVTTPGGWADVYRGTLRLGRTPAQLRLPSGPQRLVLRPFGGAPIERRVDVQREQAIRLVVPVSPPP